MSEKRDLFPFLSSADLTDVGRKRKRNEDALIRIPSCGVFCVADGMGGEDSGDVASKATVHAIEDALSEPMPERDLAGAGKKIQIVADSLRKASGWIQKRAMERGRGMSGSTVVVLIFDAVSPAHAVALHAGDSRLYRYRKGDISQITRDHSLAEEAGFKSRQQLPKVFRGMVTRGVGIREDLNLEETPVDVQEADIFLLCSDGLTGMVSDKKMRKLLRRHEEKPLEQAAQALIAEANESGGDDNVSVILVRVGRLVPMSDPDTSEAETDPRAGEDDGSGPETETADPPHPPPDGQGSAAAKESERETGETTRRPVSGIRALRRFFSGGSG